ncbi:RNA methyltransferase [candidate division KSB1 bacterium]|nr:RNA methyltransferase [candidate division KSB1 bacterium]
MKKRCALQQKKYRDLEKTFLAEGLRLCEDALSGDMSVQEVIVTESALCDERVLALVQAADKTGLPIYLASQRQFNKLSEEKSPQGVVFVMQKRQRSISQHTFGHLILACDHIQDPGNLGTILRTAEWFGVKEVLLSSGCVDVYNPKVVRSAMGALFRVRIFDHTDFMHVLPQFKKTGYRLVGATADAPRDLSEIQSTIKDVLLVGNEAHGLSLALSPYIDLFVSIPGRARGESLNVASATAILLYHFSQLKSDK